MFNPIATYRFQFHKDFTFTDFERIIPYLKKLGVSTIYASPIFEAVPGSTHGYDGVNPNKINPEVGNEEQLRKISNDLKTDNINWLQDIVPNHMGFHPNNDLLSDVLEKGKLSAYANFFDAVWTSPLFNDEKLMVPFLGNPLNEVIGNGELKVAYTDGRLWLVYYDNRWPLHPHSYAKVLQSGKKPNEAIEQLLTQLEDLKKVEEPKTYSLRWKEWLKQFGSLYKSPATKRFIDSCIAKIDQTAIQQIANEQVYRLCSWQETDQSINFRRFFTVNSLICLNIQHEEVFDHYHQLIKELVDDGVFQGLRIDHVDGLYDPAQYLDRLRQLGGEETYIVAEKILEQGENMPNNWPIQGNTGYDFLAFVNNLLTNQAAEKKFNAFYDKLTGNNEAVEKQIHQKKAYILSEHMGGELVNLYTLLLKLKLVDKKVLTEVSEAHLKQAIGEVLIHCPVYRYYGNSMPLTKSEASALTSIFSTVKKEKATLAKAIDVLEDIIIKKPNNGDKKYNQRALQFYQRLMQFSGPLMAKGVEDTLMYTYQRFIGHNEVGDAPQVFGMSHMDFHELMVYRQKNWPLSINGTSTHDTKRGEDVRAMLNVLTDLPNDWLSTVKTWQQLNAGLKHNNAPDANDEYFIYQTLVGAYPMPRQGDDDFENRLAEYLTKALREAKNNSNWSTPNEAYESGAITFAKGLLNKQSDFWQAFEAFRQRIIDHGINNSLAQVLLKFTCPGVPDVYQGCELWDLSLVDPDNRRPVDYTLREQYLGEIEQGADIDSLWDDRYTGKIKLWLTNRLLNIRKEHARLFEKGHYIPLDVKGKYKDNVIAFARRYAHEWIVTATVLHTAQLTEGQVFKLNQFNWKNTRIILPGGMPDTWQDLLTDNKSTITGNEITAADLFKSLPLALIKLQQPANSRGGGIIAHITSLPSSFGIGDFGPGAKAFANFLSRSGQKVWQLLPLNPTGPEQNYSPYSSACSMAGNTLLISPTLLAKEGLLEPEELERYHLPQTDKVDFATATRAKNAMFDVAFSRFNKATNKAFDSFCEKEAAWLGDFAIYMVLKKHQEQKAWHQWPKEYKGRKPSALKRFAQANQNEIKKIKWLQFTFFKQWHQLRDHCTSLNIQLLGDLPFYVSYDSADVWANPQNFKLDKDGNMISIAGVPPDYFNADGQLWGMPIYNWDHLKADGYNWWINRLRKNMELFDLLRLDHFRAFSAYWEIPAGDSTAKNGKWVKGPGNNFFSMVKQAIGELPFVAEDLGDIDEPVYALRDEFGLPGMKVLQFAFGDTMPQSLYIPHNFDSTNCLVYTGTHDNNTTRGWFNTDADKAVRKQIETYAGMEVKEKNVHEVLSRLAYGSTAKLAILPIQDVLGLDENSRINDPSTAENNWLWRLSAKLLTPEVEAKLSSWVRLYNRT